MRRSALLWSCVLGAATLFAAWASVALTSHQGRVIFDPAWPAALWQGAGDLQQRLPEPGSASLPAGEDDPPDIEAREAALAQW